MGNVNAREFLREPDQAMQTEVSLDSITAKVVKVHVDGVNRTKEDLIVDSVKPIFDVKHFEDLVLKAHDIRSSLQDLGCFSDVEIHIDTSQAGGPKDYEVTFKVNELKRATGSINTLVGNQEGSLITGVKFPNLLGRGERVQADYSYGTKKTSTFHTSVIKPFHGKLKPTFTASLYQHMAEFPQSGFKELKRGTVIDFSFLSAQHISHNLSWEAAWRDLRALNRTCAFAVREEAGHTLKSSLKHVLTVDRRDNPVFPVEGSLFKLTQEFAGLGGNVGFFRNELQAQANIPIFSDDFVLQGTFEGGFLKPSENACFTIGDKFFIGGPLNLRGFEMRGVGRASDGCSLGGTAFWMSGLHLFAPLPFRPGRGGFGDLFRTHLFFTAGNIGNISADGDTGTTVDQLMKNFRLSYGLGLAFRLGGIARLELNYCIPVKAERGDKPAPGLQFGVGVDFL